MVRERVVYGGLPLLVAALFLLPAAAWAQTGTIAGSVKDTTGAVLPGVTVEAASPALIEKVRTAVTDSAGEYKLVDLRPGVYTVTFTLPGFGTVRREGVELTTGITANVSAELQVGAVAETITVSGQAPLVDVQNTTQHRAITRTVMDDLPTGRAWGNYAVLIPGVVSNSQDVGAASANSTANPSLRVHGSIAGETPFFIEGMRFSNIFGVGGSSSGPYLANNGMVEEIAIDTSGAGAEAEVPGVRANLILKQGGNSFSGSFFATYSNDSLQSDNLDQALRNRFARTPSSVTSIYDVNVGFGGPLKRDKLWFYGSYRVYGLDERPTGAFHAKDPLAVVFVPDTSRPAINHTFNQNENLRVTWQTTKNSKLSLYGDGMQRCVCAQLLSATTAYEASLRFTDPVNSIFQATWNWTATNKLLVEIGETGRPDTFGRVGQVPADRSGVVDSGTGITSRAYVRLIQQLQQDSRQYIGKAVVTYVTGSHNLKVGTQWFHGNRTTFTDTSNDSFLNLVNGVPVAVTQRTTPYTAREVLKMNLGIFAQEQWTFKRLTANLGVRFDYLNQFIPEQHQGAVKYAGPRDFAAIHDVTDWKDITPRLGASYNVFGNGKTALKGSLGKYIEGQATGFSEVVNPMRATGGVTTARPWTDTNGDFNPDCDLTNFGANGECGAINSQNFGKVLVPVRYDPKAVRGWGTRSYNWELMAGVQHELRPGLSVEVSYHRRSFGNFRVNQNVATPASAYDPYCVTTPVDARLPGGGGQQICGFYDINPSSGLFGVSDVVITRASTVGDISEVFHGVDVSGNWRGANGLVVQGGLSTGRTASNFCDAVIGRPDVIAVSGSLGRSAASSSRTTPYCDIAPPFQTQVKFLGVYPLPWGGVQTSATFQSLVYPQGLGIGAIRAYSTTEIASGPGGLGRPLAGGTRSISLNILPQDTLYEGRLYQVDWRLTRPFKMGKGRIQPQFDIFNLFNENTVLGQSTTFGARWRQPTSILQGRVIKFAVQVNF